MKRLTTTTALVAAALATTGAVAQSNDTTNTMFPSGPSEAELSASELIGMNVYVAQPVEEGEWDIDEVAGMQDDWDNVGEINDVILTRDGDVSAVLVDIGGFLGIGERQVAMNMDEIRFVSDSETDADDFFLVIPASVAALEEAPAWGQDDADGAQQMSENDGDAMPNETDSEMASEDGSDEMSDEEMMAEGDDATMQTDDADAEMTADAEDGMDEGTEAEMTADATDGMATDGSEEEMAGTTSDETNPVDADTGMSDPFDADMVAQLTAEDLTGTRVYDSNDEWIGEISELLVSEDGEITGAIVDVGGFLGIGEKPVELSMDDLEIRRMEDTALRISVPMSEEELEEMPRYEG